MPILGICLAASIAYFTVIAGGFVFDDIHFVLGNSPLAKVQSFADCFRVHNQYTKPVFDFVMALTDWLGKGNSMVHRAVSIELHLLVCVLLYLNAVKLRKRIAPELTQLAPFFLVLLFSLSPIHTETILVAQFRGELLASAFALMGMWFAQWLDENRSASTGKRCAIIACVGLSTLLSAHSKEIFAVATPILVLLAYGIGHTKEKRIDRGLVAVVFGAGALGVASVLWLSQFDKYGELTYQGVVGRGVLSSSLHLALATGALLEGFQKIFMGTPLSTLRLMVRGGVTSGWSVELLVFTLISVAMLWAMLSRPSRWTWFWGAVFAIPCMGYLLIPNLNLGSEHYWYLATAGVSGILAFWMARLTRVISPANAVGLFGLVMSLYGTYLGARLFERLRDYRSPMAWAEAETRRYPNLPESWVNLALVARVAERRPDAMLPYLNKARELSPNHTNLKMLDFEYYAQKGDVKKAEQALASLAVQLKKESPWQLLRYEKVLEHLKAQPKLSE